MKKTSKKSENITSQESMFSVEGFHASPSARQDDEKEKTTTDISGQRCVALSESFNRPMSLARMLLGSSVWRMARHLNGYSLTWRMKGITTKYFLFQLVPKARGTEETGSGLFATPSTMDHRTDIRKPEERTPEANKGGCANLREQVHNPKMLPTPTTQDSRIGINNVGGAKHRMERGSTALADVVHHQMLPTPTAHQQNTKFKQGGTCLQAYVKNQMLPTPTASEVRQGWQDRSRGKKGTQESLSTEIIKQQGGREQVKGQLNPAWVEWLMGFPVGWTDIGTTNPKESQESPQE